LLSDVNTTMTLQLQLLEMNYSGGV